MNRRGALQACVALAGALVVEGTDGTARADATIERVVGKVGRNHGHALVVSPADVRAGVARTYDLSGTSGHAHEVTLTAEDFKQLAAGVVLRTTSTRFEGRGHLHRLLVKTAPLVDPPEAINVCDVTIGGQDDHELVIAAPDLAAKVEKAFDLQGIAPHAHGVTVTTADFERLLAGAQLTLRSTVGDDHTHLVFVRYPLKKP